jgi:hypothetical protein
MAKQDDKPEKKPAVHVKFVGMQTSGEFDQLPEIGGTQEFRILARCVSAPHGKLMADGHVRTEVGMKVLEVDPGVIEPAPEGDPMLPLDGGEPEDSE